MYNTMGWGLEYLHISVLRDIYKLDKEHKPLYIYYCRLYACVYFMVKKFICFVFNINVINFENQNDLCTIGMSTLIWPFLGPVPI